MSFNILDLNIFCFKNLIINSLFFPGIYSILIIFLKLVLYIFTLSDGKWDNNSEIGGIPTNCVNFFWMNNALHIVGRQILYQVLNKNDVGINLEASSVTTGAR